MFAPLMLIKCVRCFVSSLQLIMTQAKSSALQQDKMKERIQASET